LGGKTLAGLVSEYAILRFIGVSIRYVESRSAWDRVGMRLVDVTNTPVKFTQIDAATSNEISS
jgi:hypothetical protein